MSIEQICNEVIDEYNPLFDIEQSLRDSFITVINYEDSTVEQILPERHMFMGNTYFYGKIVSMFNFSKGKGKKNGFENILKYKMMSEMIGGKNGSANNGMGNLMMLGMMGNGGFSDMFNFDGMFGFDDDTEDAEDENQEDGEEWVKEPIAQPVL